MMIFVSFRAQNHNVSFEKTHVFCIWSVSSMDCYSISKMEPDELKTHIFVNKPILLVGPTRPHVPNYFILIDYKQ